VLAIDHIGSTSIPDLKAEDVISIQLTIANFEGNFRTPLEDTVFSSGSYVRDHCLQV
jgi:GrpB-like predicted nucleotidyltransferase (UPF0157 family)